MPLLLPDLYSDGTRYFNIVLLVVVIAVMTANIFVRRSQINRRSRRIFMWFYLMMLNFTYATAANIRDHIRMNAAVLTGSVLLLGLLVSFLWHPEGDEQKPPEDNSMGTRLGFWLDDRIRSWKGTSRG